MTDCFNWSFLRVRSFSYQADHKQWMQFGDIRSCNQSITTSLPFVRNLWT